MVGPHDARARERLAWTRLGRALQLQSVHARVVMLDQVLNLTGEQAEAIARIFKEQASQLVWVDDLRDRLFSGENVDMTTANQRYQRIREASDQAVLDLLTDHQRNVYCELFEL